MSGLEPRPDTMIQNPDKTILHPGPRQVQLPQDRSGTLSGVCSKLHPYPPPLQRGCRAVTPAEGTRSQTRPVKAPAPGAQFFLGVTNT